MTVVGVPAVVRSADELLSVAQELIDSETAAFEADPNVAVSCGPKCNACCEHAVVVTAAESRAIASAVTELPLAIRARIASRARQILDRVAAELHVDATDLHSVGADFPKAYYALQEPCPLLVDGCCSVRSVRPLVCREYLVSSTPQHCFDPTLEHIVKIRRRRDVSTGFQRISNRFDEARLQLLLVALLEPSAAATSKALSGPKLAPHLLRGGRPG